MMTPEVMDEQMRELLNRPTALIMTFNEWMTILSAAETCALLERPKDQIMIDAVEKVRCLLLDSI
jgi:hypothetical protein